MAGHDYMRTIMRIRRLRWMGHVARMEGERLAVHAMDDSAEKRRRDRPRKNWHETIREFIHPFIHSY